MKKIAITFICLYIISFNIFSDEIGTRKAIKDNVITLFVNENYNEIDKIAEYYRTSQERTSSGLWKLTIFYSGIGKAIKSSFESEDGIENTMKKIEEWIESSSNSPTSHIAKGMLLNYYAWSYRGTSRAKDVPKDAWEPFYKNLEIAKDYMLKVRNYAAIDPHWYVWTAFIMKALNEDKEVFLKIVNEGLNISPYYYQLYFEAIDYLAPKWHGNRKLIEEFANEAVERTKAEEGMGMYARIYWYASQTQYNENLFLDSDVVWNKMRIGIFDVLEKYSDDWNLQNFTKFSCMARDKETINVLAEKIMKPNLRIWYFPENFYKCKKWALVK